METFKDKLKRQQCIGISITFTDSVVSLAVADELDFCWIDLEHSPMSYETVMHHIIALRSKNTPALIRVSEISIGMIKGLLDSGAEGIIVPQIQTADEVKEFLNASRYTPRGTRGFGPRVPSNFGRVNNNQVVSNENKKIFTAVMIENREAVQNLDEILKLPELDSIVIGPMDLSHSYGHPCEIDHPEIDKLINDIIDKGHSYSKYVGIGLDVSVEIAEKYLNLGVDWVQLGCDFGFM
ncbi:MAG: hypothetical protein ISR95_08985, partial [Candidatus Marinimicrobia bacterium]|nr:hypothetical protein [Candidatus Neomarinimicrobiota bacterium]